MDKKQNKDPNRLAKAITRVREASKKFWAALVNAVRGRKEPLPKHTGVLRRTAIASIGVAALLLFLVQLVPNLAWGLAWDTNQKLCENADVYAVETEAKAKEKKAAKAEKENINKEKKTCASSNGSDVESAGQQAKSSSASK